MSKQALDVHNGFKQINIIWLNNNGLKKGRRHKCGTIFIKCVTNIFLNFTAFN